jgi:hypothetical protein
MYIVLMTLYYYSLLCHLVAVAQKNHLANSYCSHSKGNVID